MEESSKENFKILCPASIPQEERDKLHAKYPDKNVIIVEDNSKPMLVICYPAYMPQEERDELHAEEIKKHPGKNVTQGTTYNEHINSMYLQRQRISFG
jgi:hypothetical protein